MAIIDTFIEWAHAGLLQSDEAQAYFLGRGVSKSQWERHKLGYTIGNYHPDPMVDAGHSSVCSDKASYGKWCDSCRFIRWSTLWESDSEGESKTPTVGKRIVGSVVLPLTSYSGAAVGFQIRSITEKKFDSFVVNKRPEGYFFGVGPNMDSIWAKKKVFVVEAPFDLLVFERLVSTNVVALTTNMPNSTQTKFFRRFATDLGLFLDMDKAGRDGVIAFNEKMGDCLVIHDHKLNVVKRRTSEIYDIKKCKDLNEAWSELGDVRFTKAILDSISNVV